MFLQTPEVQNMLQTAEEPEQRGEEPGVAGRSPWQRLPRAAAAHVASGGRPVIGLAAADGHGGGSASPGTPRPCLQGRLL